MAYQKEMEEERTDFAYGAGCSFCSQTGFLGRTGVFELVAVTDEIRQLVNQGAGAIQIKQQALKNGLITMSRDGMLKAKEDITTPGEVLRHVFTIG
jgi:general secretion pathway protein E